MIGAHGRGRTQADLQRTALDHLWLHFTEMGGYADPAELQVIVSGDGCYLEDADGQALPRRARRPLLREHRLRLRRGDGRGGRRADARAAVRDQLDVRPPALDRARRRAGRARARRPQPRVLRLGRLGGRRGRLEARPPVPRRPRRAALEGDRRGASPTTAPPWARSRSPARTELRTPFEPLVPDVLHVSNTNRYHRPAGARPRSSSPASCSTSSRPRSSRPAPTRWRW